MKKKHWNWFPCKNGNLITNGKRYSLLETDSNSNLLVAPTMMEAIVEKGEYVESNLEELYPTPVALSWWQRTIAFIRELINMIWGKI